MAVYKPDRNGDAQVKQEARIHMLPPPPPHLRLHIIPPLRGMVWKHHLMISRPDLLRLQPLHPCTVTVTTWDLFMSRASLSCSQGLQKARWPW